VKSKKKDKKTERHPLVEKTIREVREIEDDFQRGRHEEFKKKIATREIEQLEKERVKEFKHEFSKDLAQRHVKQTKKLIGGVRGKYHPSKKGTGKTVSRKSIKKQSMQKD